MANCVLPTPPRPCRACGTTAVILSTMPLRSLASNSSRPVKFLLRGSTFHTSGKSLVVRRVGGRCESGTRSALPSVSLVRESSMTGLQFQEKGQDKDDSRHGSGPQGPGLPDHYGHVSNAFGTARKAGVFGR